jgi:hypothetical protein
MESQIRLIQAILGFDLANGVSNNANSAYSGFDSTDLGEIGRTEFQIRQIQAIRGSIPPISARLSKQSLKKG